MGLDIFLISKKLKIIELFKSFKITSNHKNHAKCHLVGNITINK